MTQQEQQIAARDFAERWNGKGYEKGETARFWIDLLQNVYGVQDPTKIIFFEEQVKDINTNFIDARIPSTSVMIEQKSIDKDLRTAIKQSDGTLLNPFQQAKRYVSNLPRNEHPKWIVTCNFKSFLVYDMENPNEEPQEILLEELEKDCYRLRFLVDTKSVHLKKEMELSIKAGEIVGVIYDKLLASYKNPDNPKTLKSLNMLCVRLVFCLYAEDAGLFKTKSQFHDYLQTFSTENMRQGILSLFKVLDTKIEDRDDELEEKLNDFPYVNGGLFSEEDVSIPQFNDELRNLLLEKASEDFNWSAISPTIFGAVFESTLNPESRRSGGMHYTSIENIHKVIDPLFMDDLRNEFEVIKQIKTEKNRTAKLIEFQKKLGNLRFLDPACGSGNFLTESYLSLRKLENECLKVRFNNQSMLDIFDDAIFVSIHQFYGIEINDFAVVVAKTALWIAESQMMTETAIILQRNLDFLPLKEYAGIVEGNALRMDWQSLSENKKFNAIYTEKLNVYKVNDFGTLDVKEPDIQDGVYKEINVVAKEVVEKDLPTEEKFFIEYDYIIGNPPFVGARWMDKRQKEDVILTFGKDWQGVGDLDYVCCWYKKASDLISNKRTKCAFVSTNSVSQGSSVCNLWKPLFENGLHFDFAYQTFKWQNETGNKKNMAAVHCVIIGFSKGDCFKTKKKIFLNDSQVIEVDNINGYLKNAPNVFVQSVSKPIIKNVPVMNKGSMPADNGNLIIKSEEYNDFIKTEPNSIKYIRDFIGGDEFINNKKRYCLWLIEASPSELRKMPKVMKRIESVKEFRLSSKRKATNDLAAYPYLFAENRQPETDYIAIPEVSSENRRYVPIGFLKKDIIASNKLQVIPNATIYDFGILTSNVHNAWMRAVCGRLESRYDYSAKIVYNNFPWPTPTDEQKAKIEQTAQEILDARVKYPDSSLADLYDDTLMPSALRKAHQENDKAVMQAYGFSVKMTESECVAELFKMYQKLVEEECKSYVLNRTTK